MIYKNYIYLLFASLLFLVSCGGGERNEKMISVTIEPQRYFIEKIAGDNFKVNTVVPAGQNPESYDPTPRQMKRIGESKAYLQIGPIGFEQAWMESIKQNNPEMIFIDLSKGMEFLEGEHSHAECGHDHDNDHGDHHHHHHAGPDPHIWSSISGARVIAWNTLNALNRLDKENAKTYWANFEKLIKEIDETEEELLACISPLLHRSFIIYHPALTYFANDFNLNQLCIEMDGKEPSAAQLKELIDTSREHQVGVVFIQQEFDKKNAELIAKETGCKLVTINPLAYDWKKEIIHIAKSLADGQVD